MGLNSPDTGAMCCEIAKRDASIATFLMVHYTLGMFAIDTLGNEEQRQKFIPSMMNFDKMGCFALTEPDYGSDAAHI